MFSTKELFLFFEFMDMTTEAPQIFKTERVAVRQSFFSNEVLPVDIELDGRRFKGQVYDLSPFGVGLVVTHALQRFFEVGKSATLRFALEGKPAIHASLSSLGEVKYSGTSLLKLGFEFQKEPIPLKASELTSFNISASPMFVCDDPIHFGRYLYFQVVSASASMAKLISSSGTASVIPGLELSGVLYVPLNGEHGVRLKVQTIQKRAEEFEYLAEFVQPHINFLDSLSEYVLATCEGLTVTHLRDKGFPVSRMEKAFVFEYARNAKELEEVLYLRLIAAQAAGRWIGETDVQKLKDDFDAHSRHVICRVGGEVVASARLVFNFGETNLCEHTGYNIELPDWLWKEGFIEASRVCTHPDFRGSDLFINMLRHLGRIVIQSKHRYLVLNCVDSLVPIYKRVGARLLGKKFYTPYMKDEALNLLAIDISKGHLGGLRLTDWCVIAEPISTYLLKRGLLKPNLFQRVWLRFARTVAPLVNYLYNKKRTKKWKTKQ